MPRADRRAAATRIAACVGGGSNAIGLFTAFLDDRRARSTASRPAATASRPGGTRPPSRPATSGCCTARRTYVLQDEDGQTIESHSISAGLDYPGVGPQHAYLAASGRATYRPVTDAEAMDAMALLSRTEGIIPAIESAHAIAGALEVAKELRARRHHAGQPLRPRRQGHGHRHRVVRPRRGRSRRTPAAREASRSPRVTREPRPPSRRRAPRAAPRWSATCPAGFPDVDGAIEALRAMVDAGCDVIEVGLPYSDPVMDGPTIQAAAQRALDGGVRTRDVLRTVEAVAATGTPTVVMTYWNPVERYGVERFAADLAARRRVRA